jgi:hypothetical protein
MGKIKGWRKVKDISGEIIWKGDGGDEVVVVIGRYSGMKPWIMGANGQLHVKQLNTRKEAIEKAMQYMRARPNG